ncbi:hypothetical protein Hypma_004518 [Hypsizygus marmoreus]|uniref:Uncharacterized protein n=1 Tax=Hypsizygus marmoreus TaxID=39966 RepID=A0A369JY31_HYPMA|nr:hypothetical protein Hypma_004518 [Hypsizygus marmoreus]
MKNFTVVVFDSRPSFGGGICYPQFPPPPLHSGCRDGSFIVGREHGLIAVVKDARTVVGVTLRFTAHHSSLRDRFNVDGGSLSSLFVPWALLNPTVYTIPSNRQYGLLALRIQGFCYVRSPPVSSCLVLATTHGVPSSPSPDSLTFCSNGIRETGISFPDVHVRDRHPDFCEGFFPCRGVFFSFSLSIIGEEDMHFHTFLAAEEERSPLYRNSRS